MSADGGTGESVRARLSGLSDVGVVRERNEDFACIGNLDSGERLPVDGTEVELSGPRGPLLIVCDGMGGAAGGDVASRVATETLWSEMSASQQTQDRDVLARLLRRATRKANHAVRAKAKSESGLAGMGTTASAAALAGSTVVLAQVGDSRAYLMRAGKLLQVTRDQSVVSVLMAAGKMSKPEAALSASRNIILQALGADPDVVVALSFAELRRGDRLLLCSDGLHGFVGDAVIAQALGSGSVGEVCSTLVKRATQAGAPDNVTVVVAEFRGEGLVEPKEGEALEFAELDPSAEGSEAVTRTSRVVRRLAAKAGLMEEPATDDLPATGMYTAIPEGPKRRRSVPRGGPARDRWRSNSRLGLLAWVLVAVAIAAAVVMILWR